MFRIGQKNNNETNDDKDNIDNSDTIKDQLSEGQCIILIQCLATTLVQNFICGGNGNISKAELRELLCIRDEQQDQSNDGNFNAIWNELKYHITVAFYNYHRT